jgi:hypothetical protein
MKYIFCFILILYSTQRDVLYLKKKIKSYKYSATISAYEWAMQDNKQCLVMKVKYQQRFKTSKHQRNQQKDSTIQVPYTNLSSLLELQQHTTTCNKPDALISFKETLQVSDSPSVHHQFFTVHTAMV